MPLFLPSPSVILTLTQSLYAVSYDCMIDLTALSRSRKPSLRTGRIDASNLSAFGVSIRMKRGTEGTTQNQQVAEVDAYIRWYNERRINTVGSLSPVGYRESLRLNFRTSPRFCPHLRRSVRSGINRT